MHIIKITPNLISEYQYTSGKFIRLPNRIESKLFLPELECSTAHARHDLVSISRATDRIASDQVQATQHAVRRRRSSKHESRPFHRCTERVTRSVLRTGSPTDNTDSERSVGAAQMPTGGRLEPCSQHGNVTIWWGDVCAAKATVVQHQAS